MDEIISEFGQFLLPLAIILIVVTIVIKMANKTILRANLEIDPDVASILDFLSKCKTYKDNSDLICTCTVDCETQFVEASMTLGDAVEEAYAIGQYWDAEKFNTFIHPPNAFKLVDSIDITKVRADFGKNVCIRPFNQDIDPGSIEFYMSYSLPKNTNASVYAKCLREIIKTNLPHISIDNSHTGKTFFFIR